MNVTELFASNVFHDEVMKNSLPKEVYKSLRKTVDEGKPLDSSIASAVANAMKDWAVSKGPRTIRIGSNPSPISPPKNTTVSSSPTATA